MPASRLRRYYRNGMMPQLAVFEASVRLGSFTLAARELHLAQPTVSTLIRKLTDAIGQPLFERNGTRMQVTPVGQALYEGCDEIRRALTRVDERMADLQGERGGVLRLSVGTPASDLVLRLLQGFVAREPDVEIVVEVRNSAAIGHRMAADEDDLYIVATLPGDREIVRQRIASTSLVVVAHRDHPIVDEGPLTMERVAREPLLLRERGSATRALVCDCFSANDCRPRIRMELSTNEAVSQAARAGLGLAVLPRDTLEADANASLVALDVEGFPIERACQIVYPVDRQPSALARAFMDYARDGAESLARRAVAQRPSSPRRQQAQGDEWRHALR